MSAKKREPQPLEHERRPEWVGKNVCVLFPAYRLTNPATAWCLVATALDLGKDSMCCDMECGDAVIANARNRLAHRFLNEKAAEWSLWLDDDVIPPVGRPQMWKQLTRAPANFSDEIAGRHWVHRLIGHNQTLVGGTYFGRWPGGPPLFAEGMVDPFAQEQARASSGGIRATDWVATGCLLVHRKVFLDIMAKFPSLAPDPKGGRDCWDFFRMEATYGEDVSFCHRAKAAGHQPYVDTGLLCAHVGFAAYGPWNTKVQPAMRTQ